MAGMHTTLVRSSCLAYKCSSGWAAPPGQLGTAQATRWPASSNASNTSAAVASQQPKSSNKRLSRPLVLQTHMRKWSKSLSLALFLGHHGMQADTATQAVPGQLRAWATHTTRWPATSNASNVSSAVVPQQLKSSNQQCLSRHPLVLHKHVRNWSKSLSLALFPGRHRPMHSNAAMQGHPGTIGNAPGACATQAPRCKSSSKQPMCLSWALHSAKEL